MFLKTSLMYFPGRIVLIYLLVPHIKNHSLFSASPAVQLYPFRNCLTRTVIKIWSCCGLYNGIMMFLVLLGIYFLIIYYTLLASLIITEHQADVCIKIIDFTSETFFIVQIISFYIQNEDMFFSYK